MLLFTSGVPNIYSVTRRIIRLAQQIHVATVTVQYCTLAQIKWLANIHRIDMDT